MDDDDDDDDSPVERHGTKKRRISKEPGQTRTKKAPLSALHCACGELFQIMMNLFTTDNKSMNLLTIGIVKNVKSRLQHKKD